ncbi:hypothetical protein ACHWQZ_G014314 [Mnemiopsis leidyi]
MAKSKKPSAAKSSGSEEGLQPVVNSLPRILFTFLIAGAAILYRLQPLWRENPNAMVLAMWNSTVGTNGMVQKVPCPENQKVEYSGCEAATCGRYILDRLVTNEEAEKLIAIAEKGMSLGGGSGGATILDLHSGALSVGTKFADVRELAKKSGIKELFSYEDLKLYRSVKNRIQVEIEKKWKIGPGKLKLTKPTFFSRMTDRRPSTVHDEYWHVHTDTEQYDRFHYTSLLYLNTYHTDFKGGRFMFDSPGNNNTVHPKAGRVSIFTSGTENPHHVERVTSGTRYAITIPFTCDPEYAIADPQMEV